MKYIAALDYEHLDNGMFLTSFAKALARHQSEDVRSIVVHGESEYTERIIQTGVMREEATVRSIKDLNHRLIALFADEGVSAVGLNGYQRQLVTEHEGTLTLDKSYLEKLPEQSVLLLSSLAWHAGREKPSPVPLTDFIDFLERQISPDVVFLFSQSSEEGPDIKKEPSERTAPNGLDKLNCNTYLTTPTEFGNISKLSDL